jgi:amino-acid N-acetyltransferase
MKNPIIRQAAAGDVDAIIRLLEDAELPTDEVGRHVGTFLVAELQGTIIGAIGLEPYGDTALLRSAVVDPAHRGEAIGTRLYHALLCRAKESGARRMVLLTTTAEEYFRKKGFTRVDRTTITGPVTTSAEFTHACPSTAVCMELAW